MVCAVALRELLWSLSFELQNSLQQAPLYIFNFLTRDMGYPYLFLHLKVDLAIK